MGTVIVSGQRQSVQNANSGVVDKILVKEGQQVIAGQVVVRLQQRIAQAAEGSSLASYSLALLTRERLVAEMKNQSTMGMPAALAPYAHDAVVKSQLNTQQQLLKDRLTTREAEMSAFAESLRGLKVQLDALGESKESKLRERQLLDTQAARMLSLVDKGFASGAALDETEIKRARLRGELAENQGSLQRIAAQIDETRLNKERRQSERQQEIKSLMLDAQRDIENFRAQFGSAQVNLAYTDIRAPVDGAVLGLSVTTPGAVLSPGFKLMDIVPAERDLVVEAQVSVNLIDQVRKGLQVELMFSAFQQNKTPHLTGEVITVGADRITDSRTGTPYYPVNVSINEQSRKKMLPNVLRPGMPVDVFIKTGERTFLSYITKPIVDRIKGSLAEE